MLKGVERATISSHHYHSSFGVEGLETDVIVTRVETCADEKSADCGIGKSRVTSREERVLPNLIIVADSSGSMQFDGRMNILKAGILAFRDLVVAIGSREAESSSLPSLLNLWIVSFNDEARLVWSPQNFPSCSLEECLKKMEPENYTDLEKAVREVERLLPFVERGPVWVLILSDGHITKGSSSPSFFREKFRLLGKRCRVIGAGIGTDYDDRILLQADRFVHLSEISTVSEILASIYAEMRKTIGYGASIEYSPSDDGGYDERSLVGSSKIGFLGHRKSFFHITLPLGDGRLNRPIPQTAALHYADLASGSPVVQLCTVEKEEGPLPDEIVTLYYEHASARMIETLTTSLFDREKVVGIVSRINSWKRPQAAPYRAAVIECLDLLKRQFGGQDARYASLSLSRLASEQESRSGDALEDETESYNSFLSQRIEIYSQNNDSSTEGDNTTRGYDSTEDSDNSENVNTEEEPSSQEGR